MYKKWGIVAGLLVLCACAGNQTKEKQVEEPPTIEYIQLANRQIKKLAAENIYEQVENQKVYLGRDSLRTVPIGKLIAAQKFFFYFSGQTCPPCILQTVDCIKAVFPQYENDNGIYFISPDYPARLKENCYGKKLLTLQKGKLGIPLEETNIPFIFTLNEQLRINSLHVVNKNDFSKTMEYLEAMKNKN